MRCSPNLLLPGLIAGNLRNLRRTVVRSISISLASLQLGAGGEVVGDRESRHILARVGEEQ